MPLEDRMSEGHAGADRSRVDPESRAVEAIERQELYRALRGLPEEQRIAITLVDLSGCSTHEAARIMGTPRGTVLSGLHRGRRALARLLGDRIAEVSR